MTDTNKLKELAERAQISRVGEWYNEGDCCWWTGRPDEGDFMAAATPQAILGLIANLEEARNGMEYQPIMRLKSELDRLKAENAALRKDAERYRWLRVQPNDCTAPRIDVVRWEPMDESANEGEGLRFEALDAAIDAALEGGGK